MEVDLSKIKNFDDVLDNLPFLSDDDLKKLREMGVYEPLNVEDPDIDKIITDEDIANFKNLPDLDYFCPCNAYKSRKKSKEQKKQQLNGRTRTYDTGGQAPPWYLLHASFNYCLHCKSTNKILNHKKNIRNRKL